MECDNLKKSSTSFSKQTGEMDKKLIDLEAGSMRDSLMFYGIKEGGGAENCDELAKTLCADILHVDNAHNLLFDRVHRAFQKSGNTRPIFAKFHYYTDRERVRQASLPTRRTLKLQSSRSGLHLEGALAEELLFTIKKN